ncbi:hypothetical protein ADL15_30480 [Actinoplanes awajinensis subsp. mycoplanecinus]|uniref:Uncharacterized protein n=1 Tax=Actinoplanes awajinensis subsp. mycoplanecinus TaxID=135947 RepID=A0A101JL16_9ACTN|nr:hypothetical protein ADL15_30480 [Actinoplanes awajinensis subsp. mycoplanecinus]
MTRTADENTSSDRSMSVSEELCAALGLPPPKPFTEEQEAAYQKRLRDIDEQLAAMKARRERGG